jgi:hypothetical protein
MDYKRRFFHGPRRRCATKLCGGIPVPPSYYGDVPMQAWRSGAAMPPPNFAVPNVAFAEPHAHLPQPQQSVAIIGGYAARNMQTIAAMQNIAAVLTNANQMGEGNANITYELGSLHLAPSGQFIEERCNPIMSKGTITKTININHRRKIREEEL